MPNPIGRPRRLPSRLIRAVPEPVISVLLKRDRTKAARSVLPRLCWTCGRAPSFCGCNPPRAA